MVSAGGRYKRGDLPILGANAQVFTGSNIFSSDVTFMSDVTLLTEITFSSHTTFESDIIFESETLFQTLATFESDIAINSGKTVDGIDISAIKLSDMPSPANDEIECSGQHLMNVKGVQLDEITTPTAIVNHGHIYTKNDNHLYYQSGAGKEQQVGILEEINDFLSDTVFSEEVLFQSITTFNSDVAIVAGKTVDGVDVSGIALNNMPTATYDEVDLNGQELINVEEILFHSDFIVKTPAVFDSDATFNSDVTFVSETFFDTDATFESDVIFNAGITFTGTKPEASFSLPPESWTRTDGSMELYQSDGVFSDCELRADKNTDEDAFKTFGVPLNYDEGDVDVLVEWYSTDTNANDVVLGVRSICVGDGEAWDGITGQHIILKADTNDTTAMNKTLTIITLTDHAWTAGETVKMKLFRDADNALDTLANDCRIVMVKVKYDKNKS